MASLTPLSKGLIGLVVLGGMASAVWHLGLKDRWPQMAEQWLPSLTASKAPTTPTEPIPPSTAVSPPPSEAPSQTPSTMNAKAEPQGTASSAQRAEVGRKLLASGQYDQARVHLEAAAQGGDGAAACHLGEMTLKGQGGIAANQEQAAKWFQLAQSRGSICFAPN